MKATIYPRTTFAETAAAKTMSTTKRHPDLLTSEEAAAYVGVARLDKLPKEYRPDPLPYNGRLYHRRALDQLIERAANISDGKGKLKLA